MRGYLKFANRLNAFNYMDPKFVQNELQVKLKICDIFERLLDLRQNYLMQNTLIFFKVYLLEANHEENNEEQMKKKLKKENKNRKIKINFEDLVQEQKDQMICERILKIHQLGLLPNIAKTGIKDVDDPKIE